MVVRGHVSRHLTPNCRLEGASTVSDTFTFFISLYKYIHSYPFVSATISALVSAVINKLNSVVSAVNNETVSCTVYVSKNLTVYKNAC